MSTLAEGATSIDDIETALTDTSAPISRSIARGHMTFGAIAAELSSPPVVRFAPGPPHERPFVEVVVPPGGEVQLRNKTSQPDA
jgi:hypothetical protein